MALKWFLSYLYNQKLCFAIDGEELDIIELENSISQGSNLGPR